MGIATLFCFSKVGDATFGEGILTATQKVIACPRISSTRTRHQSFNASFKNFGHAISEACVSLSFRICPQTATLAEKTYLQHKPQIHRCHNCPTEYQVSTCLSRKEVIVTIWRHFGFTTQDALASNLAPFRRPRVRQEKKIRRFYDKRNMSVVKRLYANDCEN